MNPCVQEERMQANAPLIPKVFPFVVNYLKTATGKPVITNEFGVLNPSPELVKNLLQAVHDAGVKLCYFL